MQTMIIASLFEKELYFKNIMSSLEVAKYENSLSMYLGLTSCFS